ncbi:MAG: adenylosuccinate lyase, partial [Spirochaetia bacterium]
MESRSIYDNISPLDHRYYESNRELFDALGPYLNEQASVRYATQVECALLATHLEARNELDTETEALLDQLPRLIDPAEVYEEERTTQHNVRALVNVIARRLPER